MPPRAEGLTAATCKTKTEPGRYSDGNGLMLIIDKPRADGRAGAKRWCQRLTIGNKRRDLGLGSYPLVSLAAARERAAENARIARGGGDPTVQRDEAPTIPTFAEVAEMKLDQKRKELSNEKHAKQWRSTLEDHAFPVLGDMRVDEIGVDEVLAVLEPIWDKTNETASRLRGRIENVLSYAAARKWRSGLNPAQWRGNLDQLLAMPSKVKPVQHQPALAVRDVPEWFKELRKRRGVSSWCLEFVALTWCRSGEARGAEWREIDLERALWTIPAARTKTSTEHIVPLSSGAISLLRSIPMTSKSGLVFEGARGGMYAVERESFDDLIVQILDGRLGGPIPGPKAMVEEAVSCPACSPVKHDRPGRPRSSPLRGKMVRRNVA